jgi:hypothetical protein
MSFVVSLRPANLIGFGILSVAAWKKIALFLYLSFPLLVADRGSGHIYVYVLVSFRLGILVFILISVLCGIPDHLSSGCFWAHP